jgi:hypothetical protein
MKVYHSKAVAETYKSGLFDRIAVLLHNKETNKYNYYGAFDLAATKVELFNLLESHWPLDEKGVSSVPVKSFIFLLRFFEKTTFDAVDKGSSVPFFSEFLDDLGVVFPYPFYSSPVVPYTERKTKHS